MPRGKIKTFASGFITPDGGGRDVYFHLSNVNDMGYSVERGAPVEYEVKPGKRPGQMEAVNVRLLGFAPEKRTRPTRAQGAEAGKPASGPPTELPDECVFDSFYGEDGYLKQAIFFEAAQKAAEAFRGSGLKSTQLRQLFQAFMAFAKPLRLGSMEFAEARARFGAFYVERVVRQTNRGAVTPVVKSLIDAHRELALSDEKQMLGLFDYLKFIYCYFGESS